MIIAADIVVIIFSLIGEKLHVHYFRGANCVPFWDTSSGNYLGPFYGINFEIPNADPTFSFLDF